MKGQPSFHSWFKSYCKTVLFIFVVYFIYLFFAISNTYKPFCFVVWLFFVKYITLEIFYSELDVQTLAHYEDISPGTWMRRQGGRPTLPKMLPHMNIWVTFSICRPFGADVRSGPSPTTDAQLPPSSTTPPEPIFWTAPATLSLIIETSRCPVLLCLVCFVLRSVQFERRHVVVSEPGTMSKPPSWPYVSFAELEEILILIKSWNSCFSSIFLVF